MGLVRPATKQDLWALMDLEQVCFPHDAWGETALLSHLESPICATLLCCEEERVVGALLTQNIHPEFEILRISTHPAFRKKGVAKALLEAALATLIQEGYTKGLLEVREGNTPARCFYESVGYLPVGKRKNYYQNPTEDALLMEIHLQA